MTIRAVIRPAPDAALIFGADCTIRMYTKKALKKINAVIRYVKASNESLCFQLCWPLFLPAVDAGINMLISKSPNSAKYAVLLSGFDVMAQVPLMQPIYFQYRNPPSAPIAAPTAINRYFVLRCIITLLLGTHNRLRQIYRFPL